MDNSFGKLKDYLVKGNEIIVTYENKKAYIKVVNQNIINFFVPFLRNQRNSKAVEVDLDKKCDFSVSRIENGIKIITQEIIVNILDEFKVDIYDKDNNIICEDYRGLREPFERRTGDYKLAEEEGHELNAHGDYKIYVSKKMEEDMYFYGLGERPGSLNKKGCHYINWNTDNPAPHGETFLSLYKSIPFLITMKGDKAFGIFFDNHFETHFDMGRDNSKYYYFSSVDGNLDYYFINGPKISEVVDGYTYLTGRTNLPQMWTLGYQQCRWSYTPKERLMEVAKTFRQKQIPCDTIYLDIDYMDGYRVFTWDNKKFENPEQMIAELNDMGFKVVTIIDPGVKVDKGYKIYDEGKKYEYFAKDKDGSTYVNKVWPGDSVYPDFIDSRVREWWSKNQRIMTSTGVSGIWNDMNEPASFNGPLPDDVKFNDDGIIVEHKEVHNIYGHMMSKATYEGLKAATSKRPFVVTRACYAGTQKYSTIWTGDNQSTWEHLRMSIPMLMNLGLSGMAFCGTDVGGFGHDCQSELLNRWVQVGAFTPLFRNHAAMGTRDQEPWAFDELTERINKKYIKLRYQLIPYIYDMLRVASITGAPLIRPLVFNYQSDRDTYQINDEFMSGESILVAPVIEQGVTRRMVYLPQGDNWIDYWTGEEHLGGQYIIKNAPLDTCPIFIKQGAIIPMYPDQQYIGEKIINTILFNIYLGDGELESEYIHYVDDCESFDYENGIYNEYKISVKSLENKVLINSKIIKDGYQNKYSSIKFKLFNLNGRTVILNSEEKGEESNLILKYEN